MFVIFANSTNPFIVFSKYTDPSATHFAIRGKHFGPIQYPCFPMFNLSKVVRHLQSEVGGSWDFETCSASALSGGTNESFESRLDHTGSERMSVTSPEITEYVEDAELFNYDYVECNQSDSVARIHELSKASNHPGMPMTLLVLGLSRQFVCVVPGHETRGKHYQDVSPLLPKLHRLLDVSLSVCARAKTILCSFTFVGPPAMNPLESKLILLMIWLAECKKSTYYIMKNIETGQITMTRITRERNSELSDWVSYFERRIPYERDDLLEEYRNFVRNGKRGLMNHLGVVVPSGDLPTWINESIAELTPGSTSLLFLVCDRSPESSFPWDVKGLNITYFDQGWLNGKLVLEWGDVVLIKGYLRYLNRFRSVGMRAMIRSGTWDDKVEHLVVDLFQVVAEGEALRVYVIKPGDMILASQDVQRYANEGAILRNAIDARMNLELSHEYSQRTNKNQKSSYPDPLLKNPFVDDVSHLSGNVLDLSENDSDVSVISDVSSVPNLTSGKGKKRGREAEHSETSPDSKKPRKLSSKRKAPAEIAQSTTNKKSKHETGVPHRRKRKPETDVAAIKKILDMRANDEISGKFYSWQKFYASEVGAALCSWEKFQEIRLDHCPDLRLNKTPLSPPVTDDDSEEDRVIRSVLNKIDERWRAQSGRSYKSWPDFYEKEVGDDICSLEKFLEIRRIHRRKIKVTTAPTISRFDAARIESATINSRSELDDSSIHGGGSVASFDQESGPPVSDETPVYNHQYETQLRELLIWKNSIEIEQRNQRAEINSVKKDLSEVKEDVSTVKKDVINISTKLDGQFGEVKEMLFGLINQRKDQPARVPATPNMSHGAFPSATNSHGSPVPSMIPINQQPWPVPPRHDSPAVYSINFNHNTTSTPWVGMPSSGGGGGGNHE